MTTTPAPVATTTGRPDPSSRPTAVLVIILVSYFMILLDNSVVFTGLPSIRGSLALSPTSLSWVQNAYTLVFGGLLLLASRAGDLLGRRRLFVAGLVVFGTASGLIGLAPAGWWVIAARALQGVGAAIVAPTSLALITADFHGQTRVRAVAWYAATAGIGASLAGMAWLSRAGIGDTYLLAVAAPMVLIGAGQGLAFAPLTSLGIAGVQSQDAGAASGLLNTAHQFGMALGLGVLVTISTGVGSATSGPVAVGEHVRAALTGGSVLLAVALVTVLVVLVPTRRNLRRTASPAPTPTPVECTP